jgi:iron complex outermembrane receptor protein
MGFRKSLFFLVMYCSTVALLFSQKGKDSVVVLDEVILTDAKLGRFSKGVKTAVLADSVVNYTNASLTDLLQFNSLIYFKENGYGMVSSPAFRGTSAQQTAVVWNGININSQLNGQTDFNTILPENYGVVTIRSGGGSVQYGSGAVGGSIHLSDELNFNQAAKQRVSLAYGSYNSRKGSFTSAAGNEKWTYGFGVNYMASDNDYPYLGTDLKNENGEFVNTNINAHLAYFISKNQLLKLYHNTFLGDRNFSGTLTAPSNSNYKDTNTRTLLEWNHFDATQAGKFSLAYLTEEYNYYANRDTQAFTYGNTKHVLARYDHKVYLKTISINGIIEYNSILGEGTSIEDVERNLFSATLLVSQRVNEQLEYGISFRKEFVNDYQSPFIVALDGKYAVSPNYSTTLHGSKNYRVPTFNDLYWTGAGAAGNKELVPESSLQLDWGHILNYKSARFALNGYYIRAKDMIQWRPNGTVWTPVNIADVENYGAELEFTFRFKYNNHIFNWSNGLAYTLAKNKDTGNQLLYVPKEKITAGLSHNFKKWGSFFQFLYNGKAFSTTDNTAFVAAHMISNLGVERSFSVSQKVEVDLLFRVNNLFNSNYQNVAYRPMPNRNFQIQFITKF